MKARITPSRIVLAAALASVGLVTLPAVKAVAAGDDIVVAQAQDRDQDRDQDMDRDRDQDQLRDWSDADRDRIRDRLRDGSCQDVTQATGEVIGTLGPCMDQQRLRDGSCMAQIELGVEALQRTREMCRGN